jgi:hypothetical protein
LTTSRDTTKLAFLTLAVLNVGIMNLAVLKLVILVSGVLAQAKLGFLDFITGGFDTGRFGGLPFSFVKIEFIFCKNFCHKLYYSIKISIFVLQIHLTVDNKVVYQKLFQSTKYFFTRRKTC